MGEREIFCSPAGWEGDVAVALLCLRAVLGGHPGAREDLETSGKEGGGGWDATGRLTKGVRDQADEDVSAAAVRVGRCCKWRLLTSHLYGVQKRSCLHAQSAV